MGGGVSKQFLKIGGIPVIEHTLRAFQSCAVVNEVIVVAREHDVEEIRKIAENAGITKLKTIVTGGCERCDSVQNGINAASKRTGFFAIHDGARPLVKPADIEKTVRKAFAAQSAAPGVSVKDTIKAVDNSETVTSTPDRACLRAIQTPQVFERTLYLKALNKARAEGRAFTDDCQLIENYGGRVEVVAGSESNIKITTPYDLVVANGILKARKNGDKI